MKIIFSIFALFVVFYGGRYYQSTLHHEWTAEHAGLKCSYVECVEVANAQ